MECLSCKYFTTTFTEWKVFLDGDCTNAEAEDNWEELARTGECPGFQGRVDALELQAEKG